MMQCRRSTTSSGLQRGWRCLGSECETARDGQHGSPALPRQAPRWRRVEQVERAEPEAREKLRARDGNEDRDADAEAERRYIVGRSG